MRQQQLSMNWSLLTFTKGLCELARNLLPSPSGQSYKVFMEEIWKI